MNIIPETIQAPLSGKINGDSENWKLEEIPDKQRNDPLNESTPLLPSLGFSYSEEKIGRERSAWSIIALIKEIKNTGFNKKIVQASGQLLCFDFALD